MTTPIAILLKDEAATKMLGEDLALRNGTAPLAPLLAAGPGQRLEAVPIGVCGRQRSG